MLQAHVANADSEPPRGDNLLTAGFMAGPYDLADGVDVLHPGEQRFDDARCVRERYHDDRVSALLVARAQSGRAGESRASNRLAPTGGRTESRYVGFDKAPQVLRRLERLVDRDGRLDFPSGCARGLRSR